MARFEGGTDAAVQARFTPNESKEITELRGQLEQVTGRRFSMKDVLMASVRYYKNDILKQTTRD